MSAQSPLPPGFREYIDHFNARRFYDAHEVLEHVWTHLEGDEKLFYQGFILAAAAFHHRYHGNPNGEKSCKERAFAIFSRFPDTHSGVPVKQYADMFAEFFATPAENAPTPPTLPEPAP